MSDFSTLQGLAIPEGVVTQIADESGMVLWAVSGGKVILEVEKITSNTYAGETSYSNEEFILLDIYPKTNGTVKVTYGGLTKTIKDTSGAEEPNAQQVFFGTFNGISDEVETPASGELIIDGRFCAFACGTFTKSASGKVVTNYPGCITAVKEWGEVTSIPANAFRNGKGFTSFAVPEGITSIKNSAFNGCSNLTNLTLPSTLETIGTSVAFCSANYSVVLTINVLATTPPVWEDDGSADMGLLYRSNSGNNIIIVPKGCLDAYKAAPGWSLYAALDGQNQTVTMKEAE